MTKINFRSDFDFILRLCDSDGREIGWPPFDFAVRLWTGSRCRSFEAGIKDGKPYNCYEDEGQIHIVCDNHKLPVGRLNVDFISHVPDTSYPDGIRSVLTPIATDITLTVCDSELPASGTAEVTIPWHLVHDTDIYADIMRKVNDEYEEILGIDLYDTALAELNKAYAEIISLSSAYFDASPAGGAVMPRIALMAVGDNLYMQGHEQYLQQGYYPVLFRYGRFACSSRKDGHTVRKFVYNGIRCHGQRYNCVIAADGRVGRVRNDKSQRPYEELSVDMADFTPTGFLNIKEAAGDKGRTASHGNGSSIDIDKANGYAFEYALAFVRPGIPHCERITEHHCVSNIVPFQVVSRQDDKLGFVPRFSTTRPHRHRGRVPGAEPAAEADVQT